MTKTLQGWLLVLLILGGTAQAVEQITVLGLFKGTAILRIDGTQRSLKQGQTSPEGIKVISADSSTVVLEVDGERKSMGLGTHIGGSFTKPKRPVVNIWPNTQGMYLQTGSINGYTVEFLVDTGATSIAMNAAQARRLGIDYRLKGTPQGVETASGRVPAYRVYLDRVKVGAIEQRNVVAVVLEGTLPSKVLLGMSFLNRLEIKRDGAAMMLIQKW